MDVERCLEVYGCAGILLNFMESDESVCTIDSWHKQALETESLMIRKYDSC